MIRGNVLARNFFSLTAAEVLSRTGGTLLTIYVARLLGVTYFGQLSFALAFISYFNILSDFGLTTMGTREIAQQKQATGRWAADILALQLLLALVLTALLAGVLELLPIDGGTRLLTFLFGLAMIPLALNMSYVFQAHERLEFVALSRLITQLGYVLLAFPIVYLTRQIVLLPVANAATALVAAIVIAALLSTLLHPAWRTPRWSDLLLLIRAALPFVLSALAVAVYYNAGSVLLQFMKGTDQVGYYNAAYRIVLLVLVPAQFLYNTMLPNLSAAARDANLMKGQLVAAVRVSAVAVFPAVLGGIVTAPLILGFVYGPKRYDAAATSLVLLLLVPLLGYVNTLMNAALLAVHWQTPSMLALVAGAAANIAGNLILIPRWSIAGSAASMAASEVVVFAALFVLLERAVGGLAADMARAVFRPLLAASAMALAVWLLHLPNLPLAVLAGAVLYLVLLRLVGGYDTVALRRLITAVRA